MYNVSVVSIPKTARTNENSAAQRAENLFILGSQKIIELCVGPSLPTLKKEYFKRGMSVTGNDIQQKYKDYDSQLDWIIGDARQIDVSAFDTVVVAPPLSRGCSGRREDSLSVDEVLPSYYDFLHLTNPIVVFTLPGRTLSIKEDRNQMYKLISNLPGSGDVQIVPLYDGGKTRKYVDLYWMR